MKQKRWGTLLLKAGISLLILFLLYQKCDWQALLNTLRSANVAWFAVACLAALAAYLVGAWRWQVLCPKASFGALFSMIIVSRFYSTVLPGQLFGEASKIVYIGKWKKGDVSISYEEGAAGVIVDKIIGLLSLLTLGVVAFFMASVESEGMTVSFLILLVVLLCAVFLPAIPQTTKLLQALCDKLAVKLPKLSRLLNKLVLTLQYWQSYLRKPLVLLASFILGIAFQVFSVLSASFVGRAVGIAVPFLDWCWIIAVLSLAMLLPISFAGLGVREATLVGLLAMFGVSSDMALGYSILMLAIQLLEALIGGVLLWCAKRDATPQQPPPQSPEYSHQNKESDPS